VIATDQQKDAAPPTAHDVPPIEPGHVMPLAQYEELVRKAAGLK